MVKVFLPHTQIRRKADHGRLISGSRKDCMKAEKEYNAEIITVVANVADRAQMDAAAAQGVGKIW